MCFLVAAVPTELSGGRYPAPAWAILALGIATLVGAAAYLGIRLLRAQRPKPPGSMGETRKPPARPEDER